MAQLPGKLKLASEDRSLPLDDRLSARMVLISGIASLFGMIICIFAHTNIVAVILCGAMAVVFPVWYVLFLLVEKARKLKLLVYIGILLSVPVLWLFAGGLDSGMIYWVMYELVFFIVATSGVRQKIVCALTLICVATSITIETLTGFVYPLETQADRMVSSIGSFFVVCGFIIYMINYQKVLYRKEFELTEQKNDELVVLADKAEKANNAQKVFLANMSHEVRSPLNVVLGFNHLIAESNDINEIHEFSKSIDSSGESLLLIVNDILDYSKLETGKMSLYPTAYELNELVQMCRLSVDILCRQKGLAFETHIDPKLPAGLYGDKMRIRQCVTNLLTNAYKYTDEGTIWLYFSNAGISEDGKSVELKISVKDTGRGISPEQRKEIFTRFQRLDESTNRAIEGTGLGLALTKSLVEAMGGTIDYVSEEHKGSEFTICLKQGITNMAAAVSADTGADPQDTHADDVFAGMCVLVVDDSSTNLVLMKHLLKQLNIRTVTSSSGLETLERVKNDKFDIIFMDHMMPHMDGVETFKRMKNFDHMNKETPVIMLTANAMSGVEEEYRAQGFAGYLSKPVKFEEIRKEMLRIMQK